ncbi:hypothetical protein GDO78_019932 [Eleutherodactylus coqui]|uniref:Ig-like domain-containing protein n=1 Tax=Eleutherodactylus coqui TaxID=57060 RepID=A0A8J6BKD3_ELECQ|nr:hypothetical protein GDO78_019932 [Eleutherodactylus coqui]
MCTPYSYTCNTLTHIHTLYDLFSFFVCAGFHFVQVFTACKLRDDNSSEGFLKYTYDGNQSMYLDVPTATYIPTMPGAEIATQRWNSPSIRMGEIHKKELENICVERLVRFTDHGREYLERKVRPGVKVMRREPGEVTMLHCLVYGFYPRAVDVKWMKNRTDEVPTYQTTHVLPNPDGTYQIRVSVEVIPQEGDSYSCYVDHSSLEEPLLVDWDPEQEVPLSVIISVGVISVLVLIAVVVGVVIYRMTRGLPAEMKKSSATAVTAVAEDRDLLCMSMRPPLLPPARLTSR